MTETPTTIAKAKREKAERKADRLKREAMKKQPEWVAIALTGMALQAYGNGLDEFTVWTPDGWKAPKGFPRRELLCRPTAGGATWRVNTKRVLKFAGYRLR